MKINVYSNYDSVKVKEELKESIKNYKGILTAPMIEYLESLINLDFSVIKDSISDHERNALSELGIYKRIAIYNIYNRALSIIQQTDIQIDNYDNNTKQEELNIKLDLGDQTTNLFKFYYIDGNKQYGISVPVGYKTLTIGSVSLYQTLENKELRKRALEELKEELETLNAAKNPYPYSSNAAAAWGWKFSKLNEIKYYEDKFKEIDSGNNLTSNDKEAIEITKYIHNSLLEDYGFTEESFVFSHSYNYDLEKTLVKELPKLSIYNFIKYR